MHKFLWSLLSALALAACVAPPREEAPAPAPVAAARPARRAGRAGVEGRRFPSFGSRLS